MVAYLIVLQSDFALADDERNYMVEADQPKRQCLLEILSPAMREPGVQDERIGTGTGVTPYILSLLTLYLEGHALHTDAISAPSDHHIESVTQRFFGRPYSLQTIVRHLKSTYDFGYFDFLESLGIDLKLVRSRKAKLDLDRISTALAQLDQENYSLSLKPADPASAKRLSELLGYDMSLRMLNDRLEGLGLGYYEFLESIGINPLKYSEKGASSLLVKTLVGFTLIKLYRAGFSLTEESLLRKSREAISPIILTTMGRDLSIRTIRNRIVADFGGYYNFLEEIGFEVNELRSRRSNNSEQTETIRQETERRISDWLVGRLLTHLHDRGGIFTGENQPMIDQLSTWLLGRPVSWLQLRHIKLRIGVHLREMPVSRASLILQDIRESQFTKANMILYVKAQYADGRFRKRADPNLNITRAIFGFPYTHAQVIDSFVSANKISFTSFLKEIDAYDLENFYLTPHLGHLSIEDLVLFFKEVQRLDSLSYYFWSDDMVKRGVPELIHKYFGEGVEPRKVVSHMIRRGLGWSGFFDEHQIRHSGSRKNIRNPQ
ncbi:MAG: hypothetical protein IPJ71_00890 [Bdellovibrionales bacterium]|nr:hypothetical protein [Bdellovibrionales bacterium]